MHFGTSEQVCVEHALTAGAFSPSCSVVRMVVRSKRAVCSALRSFTADVDHATPRDYCDRRSMKCPRCGHESPQGERFCGQCAAPLASVCPSCGAANPDANKFCGQCASPLEKPHVPRFATPQAYTPKHLAEKILTSKTALRSEEHTSELQSQSNIVCRL